MTRASSSLHWDHYVDETKKVVYVHIPSGWPTTLALPLAIERHFPGYTAKICSRSFLNTLTQPAQ